MTPIVATTPLLAPLAMPGTVGVAINGADFLALMAQPVAADHAMVPPAPVIEDIEVPEVPEVEEIAEDGPQVGLAVSVQLVAPLPLPGAAVGLYAANGHDAPQLQFAAAGDVKRAGMVPEAKDGRAVPLVPGAAESVFASVSDAGPETTLPIPPKGNDANLTAVHQTTEGTSKAREPDGPQAGHRTEPAQWGRETAPLVAIGKPLAEPAAATVMLPAADTAETAEIVSRRPDTRADPVVRPPSPDQPAKGVGARLQPDDRQPPKAEQPLIQLQSEVTRFVSSWLSRPVVPHQRQPTFAPALASVPASSPVANAVLPKAISVPDSEVIALRPADVVPVAAKSGMPDATPSSAERAFAARVVVAFAPDQFVSTAASAGAPHPEATLPALQTVTDGLPAGDSTTHEHPMIAPVEGVAIQAVQTAEGLAAPARATSEPVLTPVVKGLDGFKPDGLIPVQGLSQTVAQIAHAETHATVELRLDPVELGAVQVTMQGQDKDLTVVVMVDRPETLDLLRKHADQFLADLRQLGFSGASLTFNLSDHQGAAQRQPPPAPVIAEDYQPQPVPRQLPEPGVSGGLDMRL